MKFGRVLVRDLVLRARRGLAPRSGSASPLGELAESTACLSYGYRRRETVKRRLFGGRGGFGSGRRQKVGLPPGGRTSGVFRVGQSLESAPTPVLGQPLQGLDSSRLLQRPPRGAQMPTGSERENKLPASVIQYCWCPRGGARRTREGRRDTLERRVVTDA